MSEPTGLWRRIERGAIAHYEDAAYYDHTYRRRRKDVAFYAELAKQHGGPVLELGCGSGRVTLAIAEADVPIHGVDASRPMLDSARQKLAALPREARRLCSLRRGDLRTVRLSRMFGLIISPFNVWMHLYTLRDVERALATVRAHLAEGGRFVFDVAMPDLGALNRRPSRIYRGPRLTHPQSGQRYHYLEAFEYDAVHQVQMVSMIFQSEANLDDMTVVPLSQRQFFPEELRALLHYNGFRVEQRFGDFQGGALESDSESQIIVARRRR